MKSRLRICLPVAAFAVALYGMASGGFAQSASPSTGTDQNHSAHHPQTANETPAAPTKPNEAPSTNTQSGSDGMMGLMAQGGMMGQGGMAQGGMMGGDMSQMMGMM